MTDPKHSSNVLSTLLLYTALSNLLISHNRKKLSSLTHWGQVAHICVNELTIIGSDNDLLSGWHQAIIWPSAGILLIRPLGTNFNEIFYGNSYIFIQENPFENVFWKMVPISFQPQCVKVL